MRFPTFDDSNYKMYHSVSQHHTHNRPKSLRQRTSGRVPSMSFCSISPSNYRKSTSSIRLFITLDSKSTSPSPTCGPWYGKSQSSSSWRILSTTGLTEHYIGDPSTNTSTKFIINTRRRSDLPLNMPIRRRSSFSA